MAPKLLFLFFLILTLSIVSQGDDQKHQLKSCLKQCEASKGRQTSEQQLQCQRTCVQKYGGQYTEELTLRSKESRKEKEQQEGSNPYLFKSQSFKSRFTARQGDFRVLQKFTERSHELFRGIENFRAVVLELEPQTFLLPHHCDADVIFVIIRGNGVITVAEQDQKNSFNLQRGDVLKVSAGSTIYVLNKDNKEKFFVYALANPVNTPGRFQEFWSAGGENPESFYRAFSDDVLETSFKSQRDSIQKLFGQQRKGIIVKASEEQIRAISQGASESTQQTGWGESKGPFNLLKEGPLFGSRFGQFFEATPEKFQQLRDLDAAVSFMNINQGGMILPYYNTRSTRLELVVEGKARFQMACPHVGQSEQGSQKGKEEEEGNVHYQKVEGSLSVGDVLVVPPGHPVTVIANKDSNLWIVSLGINAHNNKKNFLAGQENIWKNVEKEVKELSFNLPAREVEQVLQRQDQSYFVEGPDQQQRGKGQEGGRGQQYVSSILDFVF